MERHIIECAPKQFDILWAKIRITQTQKSYNYNKFLKYVFHTVKFSILEGNGQNKEYKSLRILTKIKYFIHTHGTGAC